MLQNLLCAVIYGIRRVVIGFEYASFPFSARRNFGDTGVVEMKKCPAEKMPSGPCGKFPTTYYRRNLYVKIFGLGEFEYDNPKLTHQEKKKTKENCFKYDLRLLQ